VGDVGWWRRPLANLSAVMARPTRAPARVETSADAVLRHGLGVQDLERIERGLAREARIAGAMLAVVGLAFLFLPWSQSPVWHLIGCSMAGAWCMPTWLRAAFRRDQVRARELFTLREWLGLGGPARRF
jgi:hypothetical protein